MSAIDIPGGIRLSHFAAAFYYFLGGGPQTLDPTIGEKSLQKDITVGEIKLALLLREDAGFDVEDLFWRHAVGPLGLQCAD
jgi:hypothetical protein